MIYGLYYDITTGEIVVEDHSHAQTWMAHVDAPDGAAWLPGRAADRATEYVTGIGAGPTISPRPTLTVTATEIAADGAATAVVTVPAGVVVEVRRDGALVATADGEDVQLGPAWRPVTWQLVPSWPYQEAEVVAS